jgi:hypothetical protein
MSFIVFKNPGVIDMRAVTSFGVSVKEGENPIGFFGTGLKYALAVLLRTSHEVTILAGAEVFRFVTEREKFRGEDVDFVTMVKPDGTREQLAFTTQLGKQWAMWMAYRELACNCSDEGGTASQEVYMPDEEKGTTQVIVKGAEFAEVHANRSEILLERKPDMVVGTVEVHKMQGRSMFYRGVRVHTFPQQGLYTYNSVGKLSLTEDRTLRDSYDAERAARIAIMQGEDEEFIRSCVLADRNTMEGCIDFHGWSIKPHAAFLKVVGECSVERHTSLNATAFRVWSEETKQAFKPHEIGLTSVQAKTLAKAVSFCETIGFRVDSYPIKVAETLGEGVLGRAMDQTIWVAERGFHLGGTKQVASILMEEFIHLKYGYMDMTRELQNFLFEKVVSMGEEINGEPL